MLWFCPLSELRKDTEPLSILHLAFLFILCMGCCCMCRLGSGRNLKGQYLSCTLLVLNILIKYESDLQRNIFGTVVPSFIPPFSILLAPPSGLSWPWQWRLVVLFRGTVGRTLSTHIQPSFQYVCFFTDTSPNLWGKLQWELADLNYFQDLDLLAKTPVWRKLLLSFFSSAVLNLAPILKELFAMKIAVEKRSEFGS